LSPTATFAAAIHETLYIARVCDCYIIRFLILSYLATAIFKRGSAAIECNSHKGKR